MRIIIVIIIIATKNCVATLSEYEKVAESECFISLIFATALDCYLDVGSPNTE